MGSFPGPGPSSVLAAGVLASGVLAAGFLTTVHVAAAETAVTRGSCSSSAKHTAHVVASHPCIAAGGQSVAFAAAAGVNASAVARRHDGWAASLPALPSQRLLAAPAGELAEGAAPAQPQRPGTRPAPATRPQGHGARPQQQPG